MLSFEETQEALTEIADQLPQAIYRELNGGIILLPETKRHPEGGDLYILGQYHYEPRGFGRYVTLHYGSLQAAHGQLPREAFIEKLREVLYHELVHHLEHLAGDRSLEIQDVVDMMNYRECRRRDD